MDAIERAKERIIVALDVDTWNEALDLVKNLRDHVGLFKVGLELLSSEGVTIIGEILDLGGRVFLDGKFNDIPNTVGGASRAVTRLRVNMFNVHAMGGSEMMKAAVKAAQEEATRLGIIRPLVLGVTVLTSINKDMMNVQMGIPGEIESQVVRLARLAEEAGLDGVIASPQEAEAITNKVSGHIIVVTPGVRPVWATSGDQKRVMTPSEAIIKGSTYLVIGRPITQPPDEIGTPVDAAKRIAEEIATALERRRE
jgi:orotidine-5'-phosphate decarboxylase